MDRLLVKDSNRKENLEAVIQFGSQKLRTLTTILKLIRFQV